MYALRLIALVVTGAIFFCSSAVPAAESRTAKVKKPIQQSRRPITAQQKLLETRKQLVEKKKASRDGLKNLLAVYETKVADQAIDYELKKQLYEEGLISQLEYEESERALAHTRGEIQQVQRWIAEDNVALSLVELDARQNLRYLPLGAYEETATLVRFNGTADWTLARAGEIQRFFFQQFGQPVPISAMGQTPTHERMGLDHREAMDVAVHPDSEEGRALMAYLRTAGIPFIAFRGKKPGWATGAHIHIGGPSERVEQVRHLRHAPPTAKSPDRS
jgi:hypothetical protein